MTYFEKFIQLYGSKLLAFVIILAVGSICIKLLTKIAERALKRSKIDRTTHKFLHSIIKIALYILLIIIALSSPSSFNMDMTSVVAIFSVAGLAVSLAVQDSLANVAGGMIIIFSKPFETGDYVQIDNVEGTVAYINILHTKLNTIDNKAIYIPNGKISSDKIVNYTHEVNRRLDLTFSIGYADDFQLAKKIISDLIEAHPLALKDPEPLVRMSEHAESSIHIVAKTWVKSEDYWTLNYDLLESVKEQFDQNQISIPYNQLDVNLISPEN